MTIEWYPGHMSKAREQIKELMRKIDVVVEILDARLPSSSSNYLLQQLRRDKPCIKVLNKNDLADPEVTKSWVRHFRKSANVRALPLSAKQPGEVKQLIKLCRHLAPNRGNPGYPVRAMVIGIPNVGKSTLINTLAGKSLAKVGDKPAITVIAQQIDLHNGILLFDTPGLLWPEMSDQTGAYRLAASGAIGANALDYTNVGVFAARYMAARYPELLRNRYKLSELPEDPHHFLEAAGRHMGCLVSGGAVDVNRAAEAFVREVRAGKLGRVSFEEPETEVEGEMENPDLSGVLPESLH
ncbi:ribosome biogenesis GTPase YlqF [Geomonas sp. RF6]|uniref:ribosome biogenesis GTPase YlqF n=1 Tax=Geomonas sp. RF6 TaxID=2897342 RepID=UPI001E401312|nr:ribosome biogenesis GTPase YlqF [Geomonas sp. RF6]UFS71001.1 ribosome biogenesis GTPase YlqF [Geomonas sp. RF6]